MLVATETCRMDQLCTSLPAGIKGAAHTMRDIWEQMGMEKEYGFLFVYAENKFNVINHTSMLWTLRHLRISGTHFIFNCYRHRPPWWSGVLTVCHFPCIRRRA